MERAGVRASLRTRDVGVERRAGAQRLPLSRGRGIVIDSGARRPPVLLVDWYGMGHLPGVRVGRDDSRRARRAGGEDMYGEREENCAWQDHPRGRGSAGMKPVVAVIGGFL